MFSAPQQLSPERRELQHVPDVHRSVRFGVGDQPAQQQPHRGAGAAQIVGDVLGLDRRDDVVVDAMQQVGGDGRLRRP